ncbi:MAG: hypothetical protein KIT29_06125, partial [Anaerolineales bacterium]|nr:hypothetical protein [Anaerolineales bacterium]
IEFEYTLAHPIQGLRVGIYLQSMRGEVILTSFDTDDPAAFEKHGTREAGRYVSRAILPADFLNEGQYLLGVNASAFRVRRYFWDERALAFTVDAMGAPGMHWPEPRQGFVRPQLDWTIERVGAAN